MRKVIVFTRDNREDEHASEPCDPKDAARILMDPTTVTDETVRTPGATFYYVTVKPS